MIEGQEGVTWQQWVAIARACELHGVPTLLRSDHYMTLRDDRSDRDATDAWGLLCALAAVTDTLRLGTLVSPATFRHPSVLARLVATADAISGGRVELGLGAGWHEREHAAHGFPYPDTRTRMDLLEEQLQIVLGSWAEREFSFAGEHYRLQHGDARPKPVQAPHPPLIMGGALGPRSARLAATYADEYNVLSATPEAVRELRRRLAAACERAGRAPIPLSVMTVVIAGRDRADLERRTAAVAAMRNVSAEEMLADAAPGWALIGLVDDVAEQLRALREAGAARVVCQHLAHADLDFIELLGRELAPRVG